MNEKIVLDLNKNIDVEQLPENELFQIKAKVDLLEKINSFVERSKKYSTQDDEGSLFYQRSHNAITVCGTRGSGKSTFLRNVLSDLNAKEGDESQKLNLSVLPFIDPTLISSKENVLIIIISLIREKIEKSKKNISSESYSEWSTSLIKLSGGLCQLDGIGPKNSFGDEWEDKSYILESGLAKATEGFHLERHFNGFIEQSLDCLKANAFLVTFDDIDTQFERGWPVLESVRKYLTSPHLITLISGDLELYSTLVRSAQIEAIGQAALDSDRPSRKHHNIDDSCTFDNDKLVQRINLLEEQYLMKVLKPENRIYMHSLESLVYGDNNVCNLVVQGENNNVLLTTYLNETLQLVSGLFKKVDLDKITSLILNFPTRTAWQFLKASNEIKKGNLNAGQFSDRVTDILSSPLMRIGVNPVELKINNFNTDPIVNAFWSWSTSKVSSIDSKRFLPIFNTSEDNQLSLIFLLKFFALCKGSFSSTIELMYKINISAALIEKRFVRAPEYFEYCTHKRNTSLLELAKKQTLLYAITTEESNDKNRNEVKHKVDLKKEAWANGLLHIPDHQEYPYKNAVPYLYGDIQIKNQTDRNNYARSHQSKVTEQDNPCLFEWWRLCNEHSIGAEAKQSVLFNTLTQVTELFDEKASLTNLLATTIVEPSQGQRSTVLSVYNLFASVADIASFSGNEEKIFQYLEQNILTQSTYVPQWVSESAGNSNDSIAIDDEELETDVDLQDDLLKDKIVNSELGDFTKALAKWSLMVSRNWHKIDFSPATFERIYSRLEDSLTDLQSGVGWKKIEKSKFSYTGNIIHRQVISLLNAILVEELQASPNTKLKKLSNAKTSDRTLVENINRIYEWRSDDLLSKSPLIFELVLSCPLIGLFLAPRPTYKSGKGSPTYKSSKGEIALNWRELHSSLWFQLCYEELDELLQTEEQVEYQNTLRVKGKGTLNKLKFDNLWEVLNTIPLLNKPVLPTKQTLEIVNEIPDDKDSNQDDLLLQQDE